MTLLSVLLALLASPWFLLLAAFVGRWDSAAGSLRGLARPGR
jgi:hypothetical protein